MTPFWYELLTVGSVGVGALAAAMLGLFFATARRYRVIGVIGAASVALTVYGAAALAFFHDAPGLFVAGVGNPQPVKITRLTYLSGALSVGSLRVDTDSGIYFVTPDALLPQTGAIYRVVRKRYQGGDEMAFMCLSALGEHCWVITSENMPASASRNAFASVATTKPQHIAVWDASTAGLGIVMMFFVSAALFVLLLVLLAARSDSNETELDAQSSATSQ